MKSLIIILSFFYLGYGCKNVKYENDSGIVTFDLKELPEISNLKLSDLGFVDIEYIPLETNEQSMISGTDNLIDRYKLAIGERFYIIKRFSTILEFQTDGRYTTRIGTIGRGPDEFTAAHDVNINEKSQDIYLLARWQNKFFVYSENGKLIRVFPVQFSPSEFNFIEDEILCYSENHMGDIQNSYTLIDTNGRVIKNFPNNYTFKNKDAYVIAAENLFYRFNKGLFKKEVYSDTIYLYENENFIPHMVIQVGERLLSPKARTKFDGLYLAENYIIPLNLFEFGDYVYYEFVYKYVLPNDVLIFSFIGSKKDNFRAIFNTGQGIINDLDGGPNILPKTIKNDYTIVGWIDAQKLKAHVASEVFKNSTPKYPERKKELETLANSLKETDNPVLILVSLKKE
jgi:hypothetical protein